MVSKRDGRCRSIEVAFVDGFNLHCGPVLHCCIWRFDSCTTTFDHGWMEMNKSLLVALGMDGCWIVRPWDRFGCT